MIGIIQVFLSKSLVNYNISPQPFIWNMGFGGVLKGVEEDFRIFGEPWITICKSFLNCGEHFGMLSVIQVTSSASLVNCNILPLCFNLGKNHCWWFEQNTYPGKSLDSHTDQNCSFMTSTIASVSSIYEFCLFCFLTLRQFILCFVSYILQINSLVKF